ncbi:peptidase C40 NLP/P60 [Eikenella sp. NML03-A-027]|uniref:C40 family peptidase n=1 Tax=Eikenella sp. NML03-A-027 TaxID=1795828 RepID=UPI0007E1FB44|nr:C40 family peptidase [Eikenella sp. NML03-A-027]OAM30164.1 peptidase C40 NLP/P60 [Eikenella sp. NML03-A-027]
MKWIKQVTLCALAALAFGLAPAAYAAPEGLDNDALERLIRERTGRGGHSNNAPAPSRQSSSAGSRASSGSQDEAGDLIMNAMSLIGLSYRFGGNSPTQGLDCSGFMQYIFKRSMGITLPRTSAEMATVGQRVDRANLKPGDMVFFGAGGRVSHVGMYIGNDRFIHAPRTGRDIEITSMNGTYWKNRYITARRVDRSTRFTR